MRTNRTYATAALTGALLLAGCRSDGGFDREGNAREFRFAATRVAEQTQRDFDATVHTIVSAPTAVAASCANSVQDLRHSWHLYLGDHATR